jgi:uncharacterized protein YkwD
MLVLAPSRPIGRFLHRTARAGILAAALLAFPVFGAAPALAADGAHHGHCPGAKLRPDRADLRAMTRATLCLLDNARKAHGLPNLRASAALGRVARAHSQEMVAGNFFSDSSRSGSSLAERILGSGALHARAARLAGGIALGENIADASGSFATPKEVVRSWLRSAAHRELILDRSFSRAGLGIALGMPQSSSAYPCPCVTDTLDLLSGATREAKHPARVPQLTAPRRSPPRLRQSWRPPGARAPRRRSPVIRQSPFRCRARALVPSSCP